MKHMYVHVPFCQEICAYCDFFRVKCNDGLIDRWLNGLQEELKQYCYSYIDTMYLGGGTPSALNIMQLTKLLELLRPFAQHVKEYSFEANPESLSKEKIALLAMYGINRISLGVQTLDEDILQTIHRNHTTTQVRNVIKQLHEEGIHNISIDMMYGLPDQTRETWVSNLEEVATWPITHVSMYALTIEEHSEFGRKHISRIDNDIEGEMYELGIQTLAKHGFVQYEVSNFAKDSHFSQHNIGYWLVEDYLGVGGGAHGSLLDIRYENTENINDYINGRFRLHEETISTKERMFEVMMLGLRMNQGIHRPTFLRRFHIDLMEVYKEAIDANIEKSMLQWQDEYLQTTKQGLQLLHSILLDFMDD